MPNRAKGGRPARVVALILVATILLFTGSPIATADPAAVSQAQSELQALQQLVDKLDSDLSAADEEYNQASEQLKQTQAAQAKVQSQLTQAQKDLDAAQQQLMDRLVEIYKNGNAGMLDVLLGATNFADLIDRFESLGRVGAQDSALVKQVEDYVAQVSDHQAELAKQLEEEKAQTAELEQARQRVAAQLAAKTKALQGKEVQLAELQKEEQARQAALAAAAKKAAEQAAAEAARQAAAAKKAAADKAAAHKAAAEQAARTTTTKVKASSTTAKPAATPQAAEAPATSAAAAATDSSGGTAAETRAKVVQIALKYLGVPYLWAGGTPSGFDCSGLVTYVFGKVGVGLPHSAAMQYDCGRHVSKQDLLPGDLVFFYNPIHHVGIYIGNGQMINSRGSGVQIDDAFWSDYVGATRVIE